MFGGGISFAAPPTGHSADSPEPLLRFALLAEPGNLALAIPVVPDLGALGLALILPLDQIVDTHDEVAEGDLLGAQLLLNAGHRLNETLILLVLLRSLIHIVLVLVELDKLFLEALLDDHLLFILRALQVLSVEVDDLAQLWPILTLTRLQHNPHHDVL